MSCKSLQFKDAARAKRAESWLRAGKPVRALRELQRLTSNAWKHPWIEAVIWQAANEAEAREATRSSSVAADY